MFIKRIIHLFLISIVFVACDYELPGLEKSAGESNFNIRKVQIKCSASLDDCRESLVDGVTATSFYTQETCENINDSTPTVASGSSSLSCDGSTCNTEINEFLKGNVLVESLPQGSYTLVSYIDLNENSHPDSDEPYLCAHDVQISASKNNTALSVVLVRTRAEAIL